MSLSRRRFIQTTAATTAAASLPWLIPTKVRGANESLGVAVCGVRARGDTHIDWAIKEADARIVAIVDPDLEVLDMRAAKMAKQHKEQKPEKIQDFRRVLERKDIDVLSIATPNHWHVPMSIFGIEAGKDIYVEKPISHTVWEGRQLINAAKKYNKIVQTGAQSRSQRGTKEELAFLRSGELGKIKYVVATCYKPRPDIGKRDTPLPIPSTIDYDLWCGPAAKKDIYRDQLHYDWHMDLNTGNGDLGNQGVHEMDRARMFAGHSTLAPRTWSIGGRLYAKPDAGDAPNSMLVFHDYPTAPIIFEVRGLPKAKEFQNPKDWKGKMDDYSINGMKVSGGYSTVVVYCEKGTLVSGSYSSGKAYDLEGKVIKTFTGSGDHWGNFAQAVKERNRSILNNNEEEGHYSAGLCHMANVSYLAGKHLGADAAKEQAKSHPAVADRLASFSEHLKANGFSLDDPRVHVGAVLEVDTKAEQITNLPEANKFLRKEYRKGFEVKPITVAAR
jgi:predicted dehydrogenase